MTVIPQENLRFIYPPPPPLNNCPLTEAPAGDHQGPELFQTTELPGVSPRTKQHPPRNGRLINYMYVQHWSPGFIVHNNCETWAEQAYQIHLVNSVG